METWINRMLMGCGLAAGLLFGTGNDEAGVAIVSAAIAAAWLMRMRSAQAREL